MQITISAASFAKFQHNMANRADRIKHVVDIILRKAVFVVEGKGKWYSPVDTGRMRASITEGITFGNNYASVGPTVSYAKYVHRRVPFMSAAANDSLGEIQNIVEREVNKAIK